MSVTAVLFKLKPSKVTFWLPSHHQTPKEFPHLNAVAQQTGLLTRPPKTAALPSQWGSPSPLSVILLAGFFGNQLSPTLLHTRLYPQMEGTGENG